MNYFFKSALTAVSLLAAMAVNAQDLTKKIPANALAVVTVKGKNLTELMSVSEFNNSFVGKQILSKLSEKARANYNSADDLGFNLSANFYYYNQTNDSVSYNCFLAPIKDASKFESLLQQSGKKFQVTGKQRSYFNADSTEVIRWNDEMLLFVKPGGRSDYFINADNRKRFGMSELKLDLGYSVDSTAVTVDTAYAVSDNYDQDHRVEAKPVVKKNAKKKKAGISKSNAKTKTKGKKPVKKNIKKKPVPAVEEYDADSILVDDHDENDEHTDPFINDEKIKHAQVARWTSKMVDNFFNEVSKTSILDNKDFVKSIDQKAEVTAWIPGVEKIMNSSAATIATLKGINLFSGYGSANTKLFLENNTVRLSGSMTFSDEMASTLKKINARKLNPQFLKYVNEDQLIGYMAYAMDTKAYLQEYPKMFNKIAGPAYADEIGIASDLFSLLLDEEAISKVVKGDGLFIFNGLSQKEVSFKTFEYNEDNFETKEVMKTKKETLPDFLFMFSSDDQRLINKLIAYGVKKEIVKSTQGYYELSIPKSPIGLYLTLKNGIVFIGTNSAELQQIASNTYKAKLSSRHKKALLAGNTAAYFSPKKMVGKIPAGELGSSESIAKISKTLNNLGDLYIRSFPMSGNTFSAELSMDIPANQKNALKYLFAVIEDAQK